MKIKHLAVFALLCAPLVARAHYLWIESETPSEARVYFGEITEGVREKAGGRLEERVGSEARVAATGAAAAKLDLAKKEDHFLVKPDAKNGWLLVQDLAGEVKDWTKSDIGIVKPVFYARAAITSKVSPANPALTLDVIPDPADPHVLRVYFKQQPLANPDRSRAKFFVMNANLGEAMIHGPLFVGRRLLHLLLDLVE